MNLTGLKSDASVFYSSVPLQAITIDGKETVNETVDNTSIAVVHRGRIENETCILFMSECTDMLHVALAPGKDKLQVKIEGLSKGRSTLFFLHPSVDSCELAANREPSLYARCGNLSDFACRQCPPLCQTIDCIDATEVVCISSMRAYRSGTASAYLRVRTKAAS